jgi:hypothetical protein
LTVSGVILPAANWSSPLGQPGEEQVERLRVFAGMTPWETLKRGTPLRRPSCKRHFRANGLKRLKNNKTKRYAAMLLTAAMLTVAPVRAEPSPEVQALAAKSSRTSSRPSSTASDAISGKRISTGSFSA